jgi:hypothetical protein
MLRTDTTAHQPSLIKVPLEPSHRHQNGLVKAAATATRTSSSATSSESLGIDYAQRRYCEGAQGDEAGGSHGIENAIEISGVLPCEAVDLTGHTLSIFLHHFCSSGCVMLASALKWPRAASAAF